MYKHNCCYSQVNRIYVVYYNSCHVIVRCKNLLWIITCAGVGVAIVYLCAVVEIQRTFPKNVTFAQTMASMGYSGGSVMAGITVPPLIATFGWRGTMMLTAAALLNALAFGCAFIRWALPLNSGYDDLICVKFWFYKFKYLIPWFFVIYRK